MRRAISWDFHFLPQFYILIPTPHLKVEVVADSQKIAANRAKANHSHFLFTAERYTVSVSDTLVVNEIYLSLQGESTFAGLPCVFIRLTACDLRCSYCDTAYAFTEGKKKSLEEICTEVRRLAKPFFGATSSASPQSFDQGLVEPASPINNLRLPLVELTGGEPLLQKNSLPLMQRLCDDGFTVLLETSGAHDISPVDPRVRRIMDLKCPGSGEAGAQSLGQSQTPESDRRNQIRHRHG